MSQREVLLGKWDRDLDARVSAILVQSLQTGTDKRQLMRGLAEVFPDFTKHRLENIARTETMSALTQGRLARFQAPGSNVVAVQFVAILDARVTEICRSRDGLIMMLDDPRLAANTPPLHYMCRSTLRAIDDWDWEDLQNGDEKVMKRIFGYLKGSRAPMDLEGALGGWSDVPAPLKGFGEVGAAPTSTGKGGGPASVPPVTKRQRLRRGDRKLLRYLEHRKKIGIDDPDDVREVGRRVLTSVKRKLSDDVPGLEKQIRTDAKAKRDAYAAQKKLLMDKRNGVKVKPAALNKAKANYRSLESKYTQTRRKLARLRREAIMDIMRPVREVGGVAQKWERGTATETSDAVRRVSQLLPSPWLEASRQGKLMRGSFSEASNEYFKRPAKPTDLLTISGSRIAERDENVMHEFGGHRLEITYKPLGDMAKAYLSQRTAGETAVPLKVLYPLLNFGPRDMAKPDLFTEAYFGRIYADGDTEIISMGLEGVLYSSYYVWEEDESMLEFIIGALFVL